MPGKRVRFHFYRYQILPKDRYFQPELFADGPKSVDELIDQKNAFFHDALKGAIFKSSRTEVVARLILDKDDFILYRIAANRSLNKENPDFSDEAIETWPKIFVAIWNHPKQQIIAIQHRTAAFQETKAVANLIFDATEEFLSKKFLKATYEPIFETQEFWKLVDMYQGRIKELEFEFITPNMANISQTLHKDLVAFAKSTNSIKNKIAIEADPESNLHVDHGDKTLNGLVEYSGQGGGNVSMKISGIKRRLCTSRMVTETEIEEIELAVSPDKIAKIIKGLMQ